MHATDEGAGPVDRHRRLRRGDTDGMSTFLRLLKLIAPFKKWVAFAVLLSFLTIGSSVGLMAMSAYLISKAAIVTNVADIAVAITLVRVFAIGRAGASPAGRDTPPTLRT